MQCKSNCFELFGYDILIDEDLRPWLMEINLTPSLAVESPIDMMIKSNLIANMLSLIGLRKYERKRDYKAPAAMPMKGNKKQVTDMLEVFQEAGIAMNTNALNMLLVII
jgi:hypothetical protein